METFRDSLEDIFRAREIGYEPVIRLEDGLVEMIERSPAGYATYRQNLNL